MNGHDRRVCLFAALTLLLAAAPVGAAGSGYGEPVYYPWGYGMPAYGPGGYWPGYPGYGPVTPGYGGGMPNTGAPPGLDDERPRYGRGGPGYQRRFGDGAVAPSSTVRGQPGTGMNRPDFPRGLPGHGESRPRQGAYQ